MNVVSILDGLQAHPVLGMINLNVVMQYARLVGHLKEDILLPQPLDQSSFDEPPEILSPTIAKFLADAMDIPLVHVQESWDILKDYLWNSPILPLVDADFDVFRSFGWQMGLSE